MYSFRKITKCKIIVTYCSWLQIEAAFGLWHYAWGSRRVWCRSVLECALCSSQTDSWMWTHGVRGWIPHHSVQLPYWFLNVGSRSVVESPIALLVCCLGGSWFLPTDAFTNNVWECILEAPSRELFGIFCVFWREVLLGQPFPLWDLKKKIFFLNWGGRREKGGGKERGWEGRDLPSWFPASRSWEPWPGWSSSPHQCCPGPALLGRWRQMPACVFTWALWSGVQAS